MHGKPALKPVVAVIKKETEQSLSRPCLVAMNVPGLLKKHNPAIVRAARVDIMQENIGSVI